MIAFTAGNPSHMTNINIRWTTLSANWTTLLSIFFIFSFFHAFGKLCHPKYNISPLSQYLFFLSFPLLSLGNEVPLTHLLNFATLTPAQQEGLCKSFVILHFSSNAGFEYCHQGL